MMARRRAMLALGLLAAVSSALVFSRDVVASPSSDAAITAAQDPTGTAFRVEGTNFTPGTLVNVELCGNEGLGGSGDCVVSTAQLAGVSSAGTFVALVPIDVPPAPCPCIVRAISQDYRQISVAPVQIPGAVTAVPGSEDLAPPIARQLTIETVSLTGSGPWTAWLGASPERTLTLTVVNTGEVRVEDAVVNMWVGEGDRPTGFVPPIQVEPLEPGETATYSVDIELGALTFGERTVQGEIRGVGTPTTFSTSTTSYPWILIIVPLVLVVQWMLIAIRNRLRRRLHPEPGGAEGQPGEPSGPQPDADDAEPPPDTTDAGDVSDAAGPVEPSEIAPWAQPPRREPVALGAPRALPRPVVASNGFPAPVPEPATAQATATNPEPRFGFAPPVSFPNNGMATTEA